MNTKKVPRCPEQVYPVYTLVLGTLHSVETELYILFYLKG